MEVGSEVHDRRNVAHRDYFCWRYFLLGHSAASVQGDPKSPAKEIDSPSMAKIGETVMVRAGNGFRVCGSSPDAFNELVKWAALGDQTEVKRTLVRTHSLGLDGGMSVKILDTGFGKRKVRVLTNSSGESLLKDEQGEFVADIRIGRECWVASEALSR